MTRPISYSSQGFSLIELLIVLAIFAILSNHALPSFSKLLNSNRQSTALLQLFSHHQLARSEAIKQNRSIILCKSDNNIHCNPSASWNDGWIVFVDNDNNKQLNGNEQLIYSHHNPSPSLSLTYRGFGSHNYIHYFPDGHSSSNGSFVLCTSEGNNSARSLIISRTGRARLAAKKASGAPLECN